MLVYTAISLGICGGKFPYMQNIFSHMQKFIFVYTEISLRIYGSFPPHIRRSPHPAVSAGCGERSFFLSKHSDHVYRIEGKGASS